MGSETSMAERKPWNIARYNSNNAWLYNANNGRLVVTILNWKSN